MLSQSIVEIYDFRYFVQENKNKTLWVKDSMGFTDNLFYNSFGLTKSINDEYITILHPKNTVVKYSPFGELVAQLNLDEYYLKDGMYAYIKEIKDSMLGDDSKEDLMSNYNIYAKPFGYNNHTVSSFKIIPEPKEILFDVNFTVVYSKGDKASIINYPALVKTDYNLKIKQVEWVKIKPIKDFYGFSSYNFFQKEDSLFLQSITFDSDFYKSDILYNPFFVVAKKKNSSIYETVGIDSSHLIKLSSALNIKMYLDIKYETTQNKFLSFHHRPILYYIENKKQHELPLNIDWQDSTAYFQVMATTVDNNGNLDYCFYYDRMLYRLKINVPTGEIMDYKVLQKFPKGELISVFFQDSKLRMVMKNPEQEMILYKLEELN